MRPRSIPIGSIFGVDVRLHLYFTVALVLMMLQAALTGSSLRRAFGLWALLLAAVAVREISKALMAAVLRHDLRSLNLTPSGALTVYAEGGESGARADQMLALAGPIANFLTAITLALLIFSATSRVNLFARPLVGPEHLLRAAVWAQILVGAANLLPASPTDAGALLRRQWMRVRGAARGARAASGLAQGIGWALMIAGGFTQEVLVLLVGGTILLNAQAEGYTVMAEEAAKDLAVRDVMLSEWMSLSASETIGEALQRSTRSLQEVFPVVRGPMMVGAIARRALLAQLRSDGDGYVQSAMSRRLHAVAPGDPLLRTLQRLEALSEESGEQGTSSRSGMRSRSETRRKGEGGLLAMPVVEGDRVVGMLIPGNLSRAMLSVGRAQRIIGRGRSGPARRESGDE